MLYFHGYCLSLINHLRPLTGAIASVGKLSPAASRCFSSNIRRSGGRGNAPDAGSDGNPDPTVKPGRGPRRRESEEREENGERRRRPSERGSQRSIQLSTISIADAEVLQAAKRRGMEISEPVMACISDLTFKFTGLFAQDDCTARSRKVPSKIAKFQECPPLISGYDSYMFFLAIIGNFCSLLFDFVEILNDALKAQTDNQLKKSLFEQRRRLIQAIDEMTLCSRGLKN